MLKSVSLKPSDKRFNWHANHAAKGRPSVMGESLFAKHARNDTLQEVVCTRELPTQPKGQRKNANSAYFVADAVVRYISALEDRLNRLEQGVRVENQTTSGEYTT